MKSEGSHMEKPDAMPAEIAKSDQASHKKQVAKEKQGTDRDTSEGHTAEDSTGINADDREPIDPKMPNLPPA